ncbi:hypothetical protein KC19_7G129900 [Ceratodon purpureus]|uniref:Uncharacterized protein n=1 Tax=Ceratodon purpureus TaxID=3225 RepID=A0A8T0H9K7_CERPU|nr:hypothetical protein KC19_7G129900 [Ceratodon purpureus]
MHGSLSLCGLLCCGMTCMAGISPSTSISKGRLISSMEQSKFDVEFGLYSTPTANVRFQYPNNINASLEEGDVQVDRLDPPAVVTAETSNVRQHPPFENQHDLEIALLDFQLEDNRIFGDFIHRGAYVERLGPEDYMDSDTESEVEGMDLDSEDESGDLVPQDPAEQLDQVPERQGERRSVETKGQEVLIPEENPEKVKLDLDTETLSDPGAVNMESVQDESAAQVKDHPASPAELLPIEDKFTKELGTQIDKANSVSEVPMSHTVAAPSPKPASKLLPNISDNIPLKICSSILEPISTSDVSASADDSSVSKDTVKKAADVDDHGSVTLEGRESVNFNQPAD